MDKPSERKLPAKKRDGSDTDEDNIVRFGPGNVLENLPCMGSHAGKEVVGLDKDRLLTNNYLKEELQRRISVSRISLRSRLTRLGCVMRQR